MDKITQASINAYMQHVNITEDKLKELLDAETWILPSEALEMGFATSIVGETATQKAAASARKALFNLVHNSLVLQEIPVDTGNDGTPEPEPEPIPEPPKENKPIKFLSALMR